jgi:hypothetical protein
LEYSSFFDQRLSHCGSESFRLSCLVSLAKQQETAESDVDLMIVGEVELDEVLERLATVEARIARPINPTV